MQYYRITFYAENSIIAEVAYFRKFATFDSLINWCNTMRVENKFARYLHKEITYSDFFKN